MNTSHPNVVENTQASSSSDRPGPQVPTVGASTGPIKHWCLEFYRMYKGQCGQAIENFERVPHYVGWEVSKGAWEKAQDLAMAYMETRQLLDRMVRRHQAKGVRGVPETMLDIDDTISMEDFKNMADEMEEMAHGINVAADNYLQFYGRSASGTCCRCHGNVEPERYAMIMSKACELCMGVMHISCDYRDCNVRDCNVRNVPRRDRTPTPPPTRPQSPTGTTPPPTRLQSPAGPTPPPTRPQSPTGHAEPSATMAPMGSTADDEDMPPRETGGAVESPSGVVISLPVEGPEPDAEKEEDDEMLPHPPSPWLEAMDLCDSLDGRWPKMTPLGPGYVPKRWRKRQRR